MRGDCFCPAVHLSAVGWDMYVNFLPCSHKIRLGGFLSFVSPIPFQSFYFLDSLHGKGGSQVGDLHHLGDGRFWLPCLFGL